VLATLSAQDSQGKSPRQVIL